MPPAYEFSSSGDELMRYLPIVCVMFMALFALAPNATHAQSTAGDAHQDLGRWQGLREGAPGEGDSFYILDFKKDGTVIVTKQFSGNNATEQKSWNVMDGQLRISSDVRASIIEFDGVTLDRVGEETLRLDSPSGSLVLRRSHDTLSIVHLMLVLVVLMSLNEVFRRYKFTALAFFGLVPLLIPVAIYFGLIETNIGAWFRWVKLYSVVFACVWFIGIRFTTLGKFAFAKFIVAAFLAVNIAEAVMQDYSLGYLPNVLNAIAGILSIVTLSQWRGISVDDSEHKDMVWPAMTLFWIIAYDVWNFVFVYLNFPGHAAFHLMVLLSCTLPVLPKRTVWLQARAFTLGTWMMYLFFFQPFVDSVTVALPRNEALMLGAGILSLGANGAYAFVHFRGRLMARKQAALVAGNDV
jgi:hypothetical protein